MTKRKTQWLLMLVAGGLTAACAWLPFSAWEVLLEGQRSTQANTSAPVDIQEGARPDPACQEQLGSLLEEAGQGGTAGDEQSSEYTLAVYEVKGEAIGSPGFPEVPSELLGHQQDTARHQELWDLVITVVPGEYRQEVAYFEIITDGPGGVLGAVMQGEEAEEWILVMDLLDAENKADLVTTLLHEMGHVITLNTSQVETDEAVFRDPEDEQAFAEGEAACATYFMLEGCSRPGSYITGFFESFWADIYPEWHEIAGEENGKARANLLSAFHGRHAGDFISAYAATSPEEDIAESFLYFILAPRPPGETVAEEKILFFYEYPELETLRAGMRTALCNYLEP